MGSPFLIIISNEDKEFVHYLVREDNILQLPNHCGTALHLLQHTTINRVLSSPLCPVFVPDLRHVLSSYIQNCFYCQKVMAHGGKFRSYYHVLMDPWLSVKMNRFDASTLLFSSVSLDNINVPVRRTQTCKKDTCNLALIFGVDCATGFFFCLPTYNLSSKSHPGNVSLCCHA